MIKNIGEVWMLQKDKKLELVANLISFSSKYNFNIRKCIICKVNNAVILVNEDGEQFIPDWFCIECYKIVLKSILYRMKDR